MSADNTKYIYTVTFGGSVIESLMAPVPTAKSRHWLANGASGLFAHTMAPAESGVDEHSASPGFLGEWREMDAVMRLEGAEVRNGWMEVSDDSGEIVYGQSLESDEFHDHVDDVVTIDPDSFRVNGSDTFIGTICYDGEVSYDIETDEPFVPEHLFVHLVEMLPEPFIGKVLYGSDELEPNGTGRYERQEARLNILTDSGEIVSLVDQPPHEEAA